MVFVAIDRDFCVSKRLFVVPHRLNSISLTITSLIRITCETLVSCSYNTPLNRLQEGSTTEMSGFATEILTTRKKLTSLLDIPGKWIERVRQRPSLVRLILDLNSSVSQTYGRRERLDSHLHTVAQAQKSSSVPSA